MIDVNIVGYIASVFTTVSLLPQAFKTWKTRKTKDISLPMYLILLSGAFTWFIYGMMLQAAPIMITNGVVFIIGFFILILKLKHG